MKELDFSVPSFPGLDVGNSVFFSLAQIDPYFYKELVQTSKSSCYSLGMNSLITRGVMGSDENSGKALLGFVLQHEGGENRNRCP